MIIPGANILGIAASVLGMQTLTHRVCTGRAVDAYGNQVPAYADPVVIRGSLQPVDAVTYVRQGLDEAKTFFNLYTNADVKPVGRGTAGDLIDYKGKTYQAYDETSWASVGEWRVILLVEVANG